MASRMTYGLFVGEHGGGGGRLSVEVFSKEEGERRLKALEGLFDSRFSVLVLPARRGGLSPQARRAKRVLKNGGVDWSVVASGCVTVTSLEEEEEK